MSSSNVTTNLSTLSDLPPTYLRNPRSCLIFETGDGGFVPWNNPDNIFSQEAERTIDIVVDLLALCLFFLSFPCNILNMIVFWKHGIKERINLCLFCLSLADFTHMFISFFFNVDRLYTPFTEIGPVFEFILNHHMVGLRTFGWLSGFISVLIACERCLCVVSPLRSQTILKTKTTAVIIVMAVIPIGTGYILLGLRWSWACVLELETNATYRILYTGRLYAENKEMLDVLALILGLIQPSIYISVVMTTTIVTSVKLKQMVSWRQITSSTTLSSREVALTRTLIAISILYLVCSLPIMVTGSMTMFVKEFTLDGRYYNVSKSCVSFFELASYINATFNFFVYCFLGSKYRQTLRELVHCKAVASESGENSSGIKQSQRSG
ncbi:uncharacterized protein LOC143299559 [Babylonia areolata]|uniref:uncharacterized protein LOC143299559 n=1 Tax=Babylonia areolata TaxID=304850 RepID=UPI003FCFA8F0